jgi:hypothetical protein
LKKIIFPVVIFFLLSQHLFAQKHTVLPNKYFSVGINYNRIRITNKNIANDNYFPQSYNYLNNSPDTISSLNLNFQYSKGRNNFSINTPFILRREKENNFSGPYGFGFSYKLILCPYFYKLRPSASYNLIYLTYKYDRHYDIVAYPNIFLDALVTFRYKYVGNTLGLGLEYDISNSIVIYGSLNFGLASHILYNNLYKPSNQIYKNGDNIPYYLKTIEYSMMLGIQYKLKLSKTK